MEFKLVQTLASRTDYRSYLAELSEFPVGYVRRPNIPSARVKSQSRPVYERRADGARVFIVETSRGGFEVFDVGGAMRQLPHTAR